MLYRYVRSGIVTAIALVALGGCTGSQTSPPAVSAEKEQVAVGYLPMVSALTHFVAADQGFYANQGLDVHATKIGTSNLLASQLVDGKLDVAIELSVVPLLKAMKPASTEPSYKIFSVSNITGDHSFDGVVVKSDSPIKSLVDLSGKQVATFPGTTASSCLLYEFSKLAPGKPAPICKPTAPDLQLQALETGAVDALYAYEPTLGRAIGSSGLRLLPNSGVYALLQNHCPVGVAAVNSAFAHDRPAVCRKVVAALDEAALFVREHPKEARAIMAKAEKVDPTLVSTVNDLGMGPSNQVDFESLKRFENLLGKMHEAGPVPLTKAYLYTP